MAAIESADFRFQITITGRNIIKASDPPKHPYVLSLSNLDLIPAPSASAALYLFPSPPSNLGRDRLPSVVDVIKSSLPLALNHFFLFTGRITTNPTTRRPELLCNNAGVELIEASSNLPLSALDFHNPKDSTDIILLPNDPEIAFCMQVVGFPCGGFSITCNTNHCLVDAYSVNYFFCQWAELARTNALSRIPFYDRSIFPPRSPLTFGPAVDRMYTTCTPDDMINVLAGDIFVERLYYVAASDLDRLRATAMENGGTTTRMEAFSAHVWKVLAATVGDSDTSCRMGWLVDGRQRMMGKDMKNYVGNVLTYAVGETSVEEVREAPMWQVAEMVRGAIGVVANEGHYRDLVDWVEGQWERGEGMFAKVQLGLGSPAVVVTAAHHLPLGAADFGFGAPVMLTRGGTGGGAWRLGSGFLMVTKGGKGDGSWVVRASLWPKMTAKLEAAPECPFRPMTAEYLGLLGPTSAPGFTSRI